MIGSAHHVGIAVRRLETALEVYRGLGMTPDSIEEIASEGVRAAFLSAGPMRIELLESLRPDGIIARFVERRGEGLHHLALATDDIRIAMNQVRSAGMQLVDSEPRKGAHGRLVAFVHPRSAHGVLLELVEEHR